MRQRMSLEAQLPLEPEGQERHPATERRHGHRATEWCVICQIRHVMVPATDARGRAPFHSLCFRCYHELMQRKRMAKRRRLEWSAAPDAGAGDGSQVPSPRQLELERRRRRAQIAARHAQPSAACE